jgi:hypothetical protein
VHGSKSLSILTGAVLVAFASASSTAQATIHGFCEATNRSQSPGSGCGSNGITFTASSNPLSPFGFTRSPDSNNGLPSTINFVLLDLVPNNAPNAAAQTIIDTGHNTAVTTPVMESLVSNTPWTSGDLAAYLSLPRAGGPNNPIDALISSTHTVDLGATGYFVYQSVFGQVTFGSTTDPFFTTASALPVGTLLFGIVEGGAPNSIQDSTANSSAIVVPAPSIGRGLPILLAVAGILLGAGLFERSKKHRWVASATEPSA